MRRLHRLGAVLVLAPSLVILLTGILLQLKKDVAWIQPATLEGSTGAPSISFERALEAARGVPEAGVASWADVDRIDVRPDRGVLKVRAHSRWEVQVDAVTGEVLQSAYRRSDLIESLHDGSFFHAAAKLGLWLPAGVVLLALWGTGLYLWLLPHLFRRRRKELRGRPPRVRQRSAAASAAKSSMP